MPRKRIIDPEYWLDEELAKCDFSYRLFYIGTWNFADDYGVIEDSTLKLKAQIFPYDNLDVTPLRDKLVELGKLITFEADGKKWLYIKNFLKWQRVDKPSKNRNPQAPPRVLKEQSASTQRPLNDEEKRSKVKLSEVKRSKRIREPSATNPEELKQQFFNNPIFDNILKKYPDRDYDFQFRLMCDWWLKNKNKLPSNISSFSNWLDKTKPDEAIAGERKRKQTQEETQKRLQKMAEIPIASKEKLDEFRASKNKLFPK
jgi:hypothetical protein